MNTYVQNPEKKMVNRKIILITISSLIFLLTACSTGWTTFKSQKLSIEVNVPNNWSIQESSETLLLTSSQEAMESGSIGEGAGVTIALATNESFNGMNDPKEILGAFIGYYLIGNTPDIVQEGEPDLFQINGQQAASTTYIGTVEGEKGIFTATVIVKGEKFVLILGEDGSADNSYAKTIDKIIKSVVITY
jgi:hypothetical protein